MVVVAVCKLAVKPKIRLFRFAGVSQLFEKLNIYAVGGVKSESVNVKFVNPKFSRTQKIVYNILILKI